MNNIVLILVILVTVDQYFQINIPINMSVYENHLSYKTKQKNLLRSKTQSFLRNFQESQSRIQSRSSIHKLAKFVYSAKQTREISPKKLASTTLSLSLSLLSNPELHNTQTLKGLNARVSHVPNYSLINTNLILQKRELEEKVAWLKNQIAKQGKQKNQAQTKSKKLNNQLQLAKNSLKQLNIKSDRLNQGIVQASNNNKSLNSTLKQLKSENMAKNIEIKGEKEVCNNLEAKNKFLKNSLLITDKQRVIIRGQLIKSQKCMNSLSIQSKQLQHERAVLLLSVNRAVSQNILS